MPADLTQVNGMINFCVSGARTFPSVIWPRRLSRLMQRRWSGNSLRKCQLNLIRGDITFDLLLCFWLQMSAEHQRVCLCTFLPRSLRSRFS